MDLQEKTFALLGKTYLENSILVERIKELEEEVARLKNLINKKEE